MLRMGLALIELLMVLVLVAILLGLILTAAHYSRESSRRTTCTSNLRQLAMAMRDYVTTRKHVPDPAPANSIGGWSIAILPFVEEGPLADELTLNPSLDPQTMSLLVRRRPEIMSCPAGYEGESNIPPVPVGHYALYLYAVRLENGVWVYVPRNRIRDGWQLGDVGINSRIPWAISPEWRHTYKYDQSFAPHSGGFNLASEDGSVRFRP
ncbi:MAG: DUF1559 domain-containing protein [Planctomycetia bacterium]|nr:DUF1559 domain-containing protein [Planctomycetia bacterium]